MLQRGLLSSFTHCSFISFASGPGTSSTREALAIILEGKCYHMADVFMGTTQDWDFWERALDDLDRDEKQIEDEVRRIMGGRGGGPG